MVTIAFFSSHLIFSRIIRWVTKSKTSHSAIGFEIYGEQFFLHATWGGVQITPRKKVLSNHTIVAEYQVLPDIEAEVHTALARVGESYNTLGLFGYIPVLIARWFGVTLHNPFAKKGAEVCSEFIIEVDVNNEIPEFVGKDPSEITPQDLENICSSGKSFQKL